MTNFLKKFIPNDNEDMTLSIVKILLLAFLVLFGVLSYIVLIALTKGAILPLTIFGMVLYVLKNSKTG